MAREAPKKINTISARAKLAPKTGPYWNTIRKGHYLGWRYLTKGTEGTWIARVQVKRKEQTYPLGKLDHIEGDARFNAALALANKWFDEQDAAQAGTGTVLPSKLTMRRAIQEYIAKRKLKDAKGAAAALRCLNQLVLPYEDEKGPWIDRPVAKITKTEFLAWRAWMTKLPKASKGKGQPRTLSTINRDMTTLRAVLNLAKENHGVADAWSKALAHDKDGDDSRGEWAYLDLAARRKLLAAVDEVEPSMRPFVQAHLIAPIRPGAWAAMQVRHYDARHHTVTVAVDKCNAGRVVALPRDAEVVALFKAATKSKLPTAHLFTDAKGRAWDAREWGRNMKAAVARAELDSSITMYALRHSRITDLIEANIPAMSVAKMAGTSVAIIEQHYHHLLHDTMRDALKVVGF